MADDADADVLHLQVEEIVADGIEIIDFVHFQGWASWLPVGELWLDAKCHIYVASAYFCRIFGVYMVRIFKKMPHKTDMPRTLLIFRSILFKVVELQPFWMSIIYCFWGVCNMEVSWSERDENK